jgi:adenine deaminase
MVSQSQLKILINHGEIDEAITRLAREIRRDYQEKQPLLIGVLKGSFVFMADLIRQLELPLEIDFVKLSSYGAGKETSGKVKLIQGLKTPVKGRDVLVIEDIVDTGITISFLLDYLRKKKPASLKLCALTDKASRRQVPVSIDYLGFTLPDRFVVGYGLDLDERFRNLDLLLKNASIINTFVGEIEQGNVAICGDRIAGIGDYAEAAEIIDLKSSYLAPGLIDGHTHIESSMLHPAQYARAVVPRGTLAVVTDLHEIANVCGLEGIQFVMDWAQKLPLDMLFMAPSCVPATHLETSGAQISAREIRKLLAYPDVIGLGEMMNFPGVVNSNKEVLAKISAAKGRVIDGHTPGLGGKELNAYMAAGILSDHECTTLEEGREKLQRGMYLMIREGSSEKNLDALLPLVTDETYNRCFFVVDDRSCFDLLHEGDIDAVVRKAISRGLEPVRALQMATINTAKYFRLYDRGAIAPGYMADLITITDLSKLEIDMVFYKSKLVAREGNPLFPLPQLKTDSCRMIANSVRIKPFTTESLKIPLPRRERLGEGETTEETYPVIEIVPGQIVTKKRAERVKVVNGTVMSDLERDILKVAVVERHKASGNIGLGLVKGFGLKKGALASSVAHDSHNIIAVGTDDLDMLMAIEEIEKLQGGLVVCANHEILASLPLPIAGLLSPEPVEVVVAQFEQIEKAAASLGSLPPAPFSILSFLALPVIPELRLTDLGLVDATTVKLLR